MKGLKHWITVGTPFVAMKKERLLFQRLDLMHKVIFVASLMLLGMFLFYVGAEFVSGGRRLFGGTFPASWSSRAYDEPADLVFYLGLKYWDSLSLSTTDDRVNQRARDFFGRRWLPLTHTDDEAVQGLAFLPGAKLYFFDKAFAIQALTTLSVVALPLLYLLVLHTPPIMVGLGIGCRTTSISPITWGRAGTARSPWRKFRNAGPTKGWGRRSSAPCGSSTAPCGAIWRRSFRTFRPPSARCASSSAFSRRMANPVPAASCAAAVRDIRINSGLLLHLVTDELSSAIAGDSADGTNRRALWVLLIPSILVPLIFGLISFVLMLVIRWISTLISDGASRTLNSITNAEVKRAAFGNDTNGEIAVGAIDRPTWLERSPARLPSTLAELVTDYSNGVAGKSLAKFRQAIGELASAEPKHTADSAITTYFTWKELVHASYFDVPEFRKLVVLALSRTEGFAPSAAFQRDPDYARAAQWLAELEGTPGSVAPPAAEPPTEADAGAVSATVASTVKAEP